MDEQTTSWLLLLASGLVFFSLRHFGHKKLVAETFRSFVSQLYLNSPEQCWLAYNFRHSDRNDFLFGHFKNVLAYDRIKNSVGLICAFNIKDTCASPVIHPNSMSLHHSNAQESHKWFVEREMSCVITVRAAVQNVILLDAQIVLQKHEVLIVGFLKQDFRKSGVEESLSLTCAASCCCTKADNAVYAVATQQAWPDTTNRDGAVSLLTLAAELHLWAFPGPKCLVNVSYSPSPVSAV